MKKLVFLIAIFCIACDGGDNVEDKGLGQIKVSVFLYENCPIAQYMTLPLNEIYEEFESENISFNSYFPNILSTPKSISFFQEQYSILFNCMDDEGGVFAEEMGANFYAEVFVEHNGVVVYKGMIDNSYSALGQWSPADKHYLYDVLSAIFNGEDVPWDSNIAVGCLI